MKLTIDIPDSLYLAYQSTLSTKTEDEVKAALRTRLLAWLPALMKADPSDRWVILTGDDRRAIEAVFQTTIADGKDLIKRIKTLSAVTIGPLVFHLSPSESIRLAEQARFNGWTPDRWFAITCEEIRDRIFERF